ncbi:hypothetical protein L1987_49769 [Smallanthus sonchifolius]|uniref:Uncharacterized protein n=1 Tax=Smallanthus sonchifolius TaxID=185202 RepID=A0ACB9FVN3_9ASTR|nr:hypothetical protein L1987_49769 [Smallanthus sonchifolius]
MESARSLHLDSLKIATLELVCDKDSLQKVCEEEALLKNLLDSLYIELENIKNEHEELKEKEAKTKSVGESKVTGTLYSESRLSVEQYINFVKALKVVNWQE